MQKFFKIVTAILCTIIGTFLSYPTYSGSLLIDNNNGNYTTCTNSGNMIAVATKAYQGSPPINWELYLNNLKIQQQTTNPPFKVNGTAKATFSVPVAAGDYYVYAYSGSIGIFTSPESTNHINISVINNLWGNIPAFSINNLWFQTIGVPTQFAPTTSDIYSVKASGPISLDGTLSCGFGGQNFFISIQLSDIWFNRYNWEANAWFNRNGSNSQYGGIKNFNLKKFAEDKWFIFSPGQYYRVKLAFGNPWKETSRLIKIIP